MDTKGDQAGVAIYLTSDRLANLSDTIFGVAMTLVVTTLLPFVQTHKGSLLDILSEMSGELFTVVLSFAISARYWVSQQQRLAMARAVTARQTWLHFVFLFLIVLVPITTSLPGLAGSGAIWGSVMVYSAHLSLIALVNLLLWIEVHRSAAAHVQILASSLALTLFVTALAVGALRPALAAYFWGAVLITTQFIPTIARRLHRP